MSLLGFILDFIDWKIEVKMRERVWLQEASTINAWLLTSPNAIK